MKKLLSLLTIILLSFGIVGNVFAEKECRYEKVSKEYDKIETQSFRPDINGGKINFLAKKGSIKYKVENLIEKKQDWSLLPSTGGPFNCKNGNNLNFEVKHILEILDNGKIIVKEIGTGKKIGREYDYIYDCDFRYLDNQKIFVFIGRRDKKDFIVENGKEVSEYTKIENIYVLNNSILFIASKDNKQFLVKRICDSKQNSNNQKNSTKNLQIKIISNKLLFKQLALSKKNLRKTSKGQNYIKKIDLISEKLSVKKLVNLYNKIGKIKEKYKGKTSRNYEKVKDILDYLEAKIGMRLNKEDNVEKIENF